MSGIGVISCYNGRFFLIWHEGWPSFIHVFLTGHTFRSRPPCPPDFWCRAAGGVKQIRFTTWHIRPRKQEKFNLYVLEPRFTHLFHPRVICPFPYWHLKIFLLLPLALSPPSSPLTVKVILIKSSHRTELLIAPRRSGWFQIQIKARRLFFFLFSFFLSQAPLSPSSPLFHHVKYNLSISRVDCHNPASAPITSQDRAGGKGEERWIFHPHDHRMISNWHTRARVHARPRALPP